MPCCHQVMSCDNCPGDSLVLDKVLGQPFLLFSAIKHTNCLYYLPQPGNDKLRWNLRFRQYLIETSHSLVIQFETIQKVNILVTLLLFGHKNHEANKRIHFMWIRFILFRVELVSQSRLTAKISTVWCEIDANHHSYIVTHQIILCLWTNYKN